MISAPSTDTPILASTSMSSSSASPSPASSGVSTDLPNCLAITSPRTLHTSVDFPDPETPVTATNAPSGMSTSTSCRLWNVMPRKRITPTGVRVDLSACAPSVNR